MIYWIFFHILIGENDMDLKQDKITTLHEFNVNKKELFKTVSDCSEDRPAAVVMPMLYREITNDALANIKKGLNKRHIKNAECEQNLYC